MHGVEEVASYQARMRHAEGRRMNRSPACAAPVEELGLQGGMLGAFLDVPVQQVGIVGAKPLKQEHCVLGSVCRGRASSMEGGDDEHVRCRGPHHTGWQQPRRLLKRPMPFSGCSDGAVQRKLNSLPDEVRPLPMPTADH